jgi:hypothetical protein
MNMDGAACQDAGMGRSFPMWTLSRDAKSVTSVHSAGKGAKNSPVTAGENRILAWLMRLSSAPSMHCETPKGPKVELRPNVHRHGT